MARLRAILENGGHVR